MLSKYPVHGQYNDYKVDVSKKYVTLGMYQWVVKVYTFNQNKKYFKYKKVYTFETGWRNYDHYIGKYVQLACLGVKEYEEGITERNKNEIAHEKGIKLFEAWDGKLQ